MEDTLKLTIIAARVANVHLEIAAMSAENQCRILNGGNILYGYDAFMLLATKHGIDTSSINNLLNKGDKGEPATNIL